MLGSPYDANRAASLVLAEPQAPPMVSSESSLLSVVTPETPTGKSSSRAETRRSGDRKSSSRCSTDRDRSPAHNWLGEAESQAAAASATDDEDDEPVMAAAGQATLVRKSAVGGSQAKERYAQLAAASPNTYRAAKKGAAAWEADGSADGLMIEATEGVAAVVDGNALRDCDCCETGEAELV